MAREELGLQAKDGARSPSARPQRSNSTQTAAELTEGSLPVFLSRSVVRR